MKLKLLFLLYFLSHLGFSQNPDLELIAEEIKDENYAMSYILKIKNNSKERIKFIKAVDGSFWNIILPYIECVAESFENDRWRKHKRNIIKSRCGQIVSWKSPEYITEIAPQQTIEIGQSRIWYGHARWFKILDRNKLRISFIYKNYMDKIDLKEIKRQGIKPLILFSNKIEKDIDINCPKPLYDQLTQEYINEAIAESLKNYKAEDFMKYMKKINNTNGKSKDILNEVFGVSQASYISHFMFQTKDKYKCRFILYKLDNTIYLGVYAGKHYFTKKPQKNADLEYYFGTFPFDKSILSDHNYLYLN